MIEHRIGDLLEQDDLTHIAHQANLYHTFGSGIAKTIKTKYPRAYVADVATPYGDTSKLGSWSVSEASVVGQPDIINLYTQSGISSTHRCTSYEAMGKAFAGLSNHLAHLGKPVKLGMPFKIGCGLGGGDWSVVEALIHKHFDSAPFDVVICRLP